MVLKKVVDAFTFLFVCVNCEHEEEFAYED